MDELGPNPLTSNDTLRDTTKKESLWQTLKRITREETSSYKKFEQERKDSIKLV